jgi:hypothetical protein
MWWDSKLFRQIGDQGRLLVSVASLPCFPCSLFQNCLGKGGRGDTVRGDWVVGVTQQPKCGMGGGGKFANEGMGGVMKLMRAPTV